MSAVDVDRLALFVREDARDAVRERQAHVIVGLFGLLGAVVAYNTGQMVRSAPPTMEVELVAQLFGPLTLLVPLIALGFVAPRIVQQRTTGSLTLVLGLPFSRRTVVLGTFVGRTIVIAAGTLTALLVGVPVGVARGVPLDPITLIGAVIGLVVLVATFTAVAVMLSTVTRTSTQATVAAFVAYAVFVLGLWDMLPIAGLYLLNGFSMPATVPDWVAVVRALDPLTAFGNGIGGVVPGVTGPGGPAPADPAIYERPIVALLIVGAWIAGTIEIGYRRFQSVDL